jgi:hypothetical protein
MNENEVIERKIEFKLQYLEMLFKETEKVHSEISYLQKMLKREPPPER